MLWKIINEGRLLKGANKYGACPLFKSQHLSKFEQDAAGLRLFMTN